MPGQQNDEALLCGDTPLHVAVKANESISTIKSLLDAFPEVIYLADRSGMLPLHLACKHCSQNMNKIKVLIDANPNAVSECTMCHPSQQDDMEISMQLYPVQIAIESNASLDVIKLLSQSNPSILLEKDKNGHNALHRALFKCLPLEFIHAILSSNKKLLNSMDDSLNRPLHNATRWGNNFNTIKYLITLCPRAIQKRNFNGRTPLDLAYLYGCGHEAISLLKEAEIAVGKLNCGRMDTSWNQEP